MNNIYLIQLIKIKKNYIFFKENDKLYFTIMIVRVFDFKIF